MVVRTAHNSGILKVLGIGSMKFICVMLFMGLQIHHVLLEMTVVLAVKLTLLFRQV